MPLRQDEIEMTLFGQLGCRLRAKLHRHVRIPRGLFRLIEEPACRYRWQPRDSHARRILWRAGRPRTRRPRYQAADSARRNPRTHPHPWRFYRRRENGFPPQRFPGRFIAMSPPRSGIPDRPTGPVRLRHIPQSIRSAKNRRPPRSATREGRLVGRRNHIRRTASLTILGQRHPTALRFHFGEPPLSADATPSAALVSMRAEPLSLAPSSQRAT